MDLALFNLDETLICEDSTSLWLRWLASQGYARNTLPEVSSPAFRYCQGELSFEDYMSNALTPLAGMGRLTVSGWVRRFIQRDILPRVYPAAREKMAWHQQRGDRVMLVSASGEHLVTPVAQQLGADGALATGVEIIDDRYSGLIRGAMSYKEGKVIQLTDWLATQKEPRFTRTWAYSNSVNDLPLLEHADHAHVVNPAESLSQLAQQRGWGICRWVK